MEKKILIVEDEADIREALAEAALQEKFLVSVAENGEVGLQKALSEKPDLILLDIKMPVLDGHQMLEKLRQDSWGKSVKVLMLTSMDDVQNIGEAHEGGITGYVIKAHNSLDEIIARVKLEIFT